MRPSTTTFKGITSAWAALVLVMILVAAAEAAAGTIQLQPRARVSDTTITLQDVARLEGERAEALAQMPLVQLDENQRRTRITAEHVRQRLHEENIHWGLISLRGQRVCFVQRVSEKSTEPADEQDEGSESKPTGPTLKDLLTARIAELAETPAEQLRIRFRSHDEQRLKMPVRGREIALEPVSRGGLGRVPVRVRRMEGGNVLESFTISAHVQRRVEALVARRTISRGDAFHDDAVELREIYISSRHTEPLRDHEALANQQAGAVIREGSAIYPDDVRSPTLIRRGQTVTVRIRSGGLMIRTTARAREDGAAGDVIRVRNENSRETYEAKVIGPREAAINLNDDAEGDLIDAS